MVFATASFVEALKYREFRWKPWRDSQPKMGPGQKTMFCGPKKLLVKIGVKWFPFSVGLKKGPMMSLHEQKSWANCAHLVLVVVSVFLFSPKKKLGKWSKLSSIFPKGWFNHQLGLSYYQFCLLVGSCEKAHILHSWKIQVYIYIYLYWNIYTVYIYIDVLFLGSMSSMMRLPFFPKVGSGLSQVGTRAIELQGGWFPGEFHGVQKLRWLKVMEMYRYICRINVNVHYECTCVNMYKCIYVYIYIHVYV